MPHLRVPGARWRQQPNGLFTLDRGAIEEGLITLAMPGGVGPSVQGFDPTNFISGEQGVSGSANARAEWVTADEYGNVAQYHPAGGSNGNDYTRWNDTDAGSDFAIIWCGTPDNITTTNGTLLCRGLDGSGAGWYAALAYTNSNSVEGRVVDSSPAQNNVTLSVSGLTTGRHERIGFRKSGTTAYVYDWRTRTSTSGSAGNGGLRASNTGTVLVSGGSATGGGHSRLNTLLVFNNGLSDERMWSLLDNPWQVMRKPEMALYFAVGTSPVLAGVSKVLWM